MHIYSDWKIKEDLPVDLALVIQAVTSQDLIVNDVNYFTNKLYADDTEMFINSR